MRKKKQSKKSEDYVLSVIAGHCRKCGHPIPSIGYEKHRGNPNDARDTILDLRTVAIQILHEFSFTDHALSHFFGIPVSRVIKLKRRIKKGFPKLQVSKVDDIRFNGAVLGWIRDNARIKRS